MAVLRLTGAELIDPCEKTKGMNPKFASGTSA